MNATDNSTSPLVKVLVFLGVGFGALLVLVFGLLVWIGMDAPDTHVIAGNQMNAEHHEIARRVGILAPGEDAVFYYSYGMEKDEQVVVVTPTAVNLYNREAPMPVVQVPFDGIDGSDLYRDTSFLNDSEISLELSDGRVVSFLVSSDQRGDLQVHQYIQKRVAYYARQ